ncbi:hypothetical protein C2U69_09670 [Cupriavidus pinatubonensis]|uniref:Uncharacterized protein n=1 Tax=Cupriavidus pinatubonensis (strain JMP 134 / LMG 1197) TaxID=264198 RepID=Q46P64_CUPPJ|nr:hypothetical protein C2U69_09670 [Cupriavidus pinatubonensis]
MGGGNAVASFCPGFVERIVYLLVEKVVRGQYCRSAAGGDPMPGYVSEPGIRERAKAGADNAARRRSSSHSDGGIPSFNVRLELVIEQGGPDL